MSRPRPRHRRSRLPWLRTSPIEKEPPAVTTPEPPTPLAVQCPACLASPGFPCTQPRHNDRWAVKWFHLAREAAATEAAA